MEVSCPLGTTRPVPREKFSREPNNKFFIDQAQFSVKMAGCWPRSFFCEIMDLDSVSVQKHTQKELGQYPAILTKKAWSITYIGRQAAVACKTSPKNDLFHYQTKFGGGLVAFWLNVLASLKRVFVGGWINF